MLSRISKKPLQGIVAQSQRFLASRVKRSPMRIIERVIVTPAATLTPPGPATTVQGNQSTSSETKSDESDKKKESYWRGVYEDAKKRPLTYIFRAYLLVAALTAAYRFQDDIKAMANKGGRRKGKKGDIVEEITITPLNDKISGYQADIIEELEGSEAANQWRLLEELFKQIGLRIQNLSSEQLEQLMKIQKKHESLMAAILKEEYALAQSYPIILNNTFKGEEIKAKANGASSNTAGEKTPATGYKGVSTDVSLDPVRKEYIRVMEEKLNREMQFIADIFNVLTPEQRKEFSRKLTASTIDNSFIQRMIDSWSENKSTLLTLSEIQAINSAFYQGKLLKLLSVKNHPRVFVLRFDGDMMASQVSHLREEITAVLSMAQQDRGDEVMLVLNSGGGTVTGYGLAAAQLKRIKDHRLKLTVCVDEVAASGGYMMASVGDRIVASPFAILGSIGVVSTNPNFSERLKREGVSVDDVTAGDYKRTLTPYKKPTDSDRAKTQDNVNQIHSLFKSFLNSQRPSLDVDKVATGEVWLGTDALKRGLCDELATSDDVMTKMRSNGAELYLIKHSIQSAFLRNLLGVEASWEGLGQYLTHQARKEFSRIVLSGGDVQINSDKRMEYLIVDSSNSSNIQC